MIQHLLTFICQLPYLQEEAYLREAIKASLEDEKARKERSGGNGGDKKISSEGADLLIDFMDDFASSG